MTHGPHCNGCPLQSRASGFGSLDGTGWNGVFLVGEALGRDEVATGKPFQGGAGKLLDRMLTRRNDPATGVPLKREDFLIGNVINCRPPDNEITNTPYEEEAIAHCAPYLIKALEIHKPRVIVGLGNQPLRWFTGQWGITKLRGYVFETKWGPFIGTYHPDYIMRGKFPYAKIFQQDILKALYVARHGIPKVPKKYDLRPSPEAVSAFWARYQAAGMPLLSWDIETPYSKGQKDEKDDALVTEKFLEDDPSYKIILRISFSFEPYTAITMPWCRPYTDIIKVMLESKGDKLVWNKHFDVPRVGAHGVRVGGRIYDGMDAFHFLEPSLPMGLKSAATYYCPDMHAWKLDSREQPEWYNAADSDTALRCFLGIRSDLEKEGRWETFERHFVDLSGVLNRMSIRGVLVDRGERKKRREEFEEKLEIQTAALQPQVPITVRKKKVFRSTEEKLRKGGKWKEGMMMEVTVLEPWKEPKPAKPPKLSKSPKVRVARPRKEKSQSAPGESESNPLLEPDLKGLFTEGKPKRKKRIKAVMENAVPPQPSSMVS